MMARQRLDQTMVSRKLVPTRSQAGSYIKLGHVKGKTRRIMAKPGYLTANGDTVELTAPQQYVSTGGAQTGSGLRRSSQAGL